MVRFQGQTTKLKCSLCADSFLRLNATNICCWLSYLKIGIKNFPLNKQVSKCMCMYSNWQVCRNIVSVISEFSARIAWKLQIAWGVLFVSIIKRICDDEQYTRTLNAPPQPCGMLTAKVSKTSSFKYFMFL